MNLASFYMLYAAKAIYIASDYSLRSEIVTKSSENPLLLGHLQNYHKFLSNHVICIEESQNSLLQVFSKIKKFVCLFLAFHF